MEVPCVDLFGRWSAACIRCPHCHCDWHTTCSSHISITCMHATSQLQCICMLGPCSVTRAVILGWQIDLPCLQHLTGYCLFWLAAVDMDYLFDQRGVLLFRFKGGWPPSTCHVIQLFPLRPERHRVVYEGVCCCPPQIPVWRQFLLRM